MFKQGDLKNRHENGTLFKRLAYFYMTAIWYFESFQYFNFETNFLKNENLFETNNNEHDCTPNKISKWFASQ